MTRHPSIDVNGRRSDRSVGVVCGPFVRVPCTHDPKLRSEKIHGLWRASSKTREETKPKPTVRTRGAASYSPNGRFGVELHQRLSPNNRTAPSRSGTSSFFSNAAT